jgi:hypothetical protein
MSIVQMLKDGEFTAEQKHVLELAFNATLSRQQHPIQPKSSSTRYVSRSGA